MKKALEKYRVLFSSITLAFCMCALVVSGFGQTTVRIKKDSDEVVVTGDVPGGIDQILAPSAVDATIYAATVQPFGFEDISGTGTEIVALTGADDGSTSIAPAGFTFPFFGANQSTFFVGSNGVISFGSGVTNFSNPDLTASPTQATIAPFMMIF